MGEYTNACNNFINAVQILYDSSIKKAAYDKTIQAQVLSCQDATIGKYRCRYQDAVIYAYASTPDVTFTNNAYVYILVPNGDMSKEKTIIGTTKKLGINYISQAVGDQAYNIVGNNTITSNDIFYLDTNNINYKRVIYQNGSTSNITLDTEALVKYIKQSSSLIVGATFKTSIPPARQTRGHYGITYNLKFLDNTSNQQVIRSYTVDEDDMTDNPYRLIYETRQYKIFDIDGPNFIGIESIQIFNSDFPSAEGTETSAELTSGDIEITKLEITGAIRMTESEINGIAITFYTPQGLYFVANAPAGSVKTITAQVRIKGKLVSAAQNIPFYWGMENVNITSKSQYYNKYLGKGWKCLNEGNVISQGTQTANPTIEWTPSGDTFILKLSEATAKNNRFKVAIVYDNSVITKEINIQNLGASIPDITIQSSAGTQFYYDIGHPTLTCKINGNEYAEGYTYYWAYQDNSGGIEPLSQTTELNIQYQEISEELNALRHDIEIGTKFVNAQTRHLEILEENIKHFDFVQRVKENKIYDVQINNITKLGIFKCSVYNTVNGNYLGTASITLTNSLEGEGLYSLVINNGAVTYQYNENGIAPNNKSLDVQQQIQGLSFTIYDNLGNEIDNNVILNDKENCKIRWCFPIKQTMLIDQNTESSGTDPTLTYIYYDDRVNLVYGIAQKYDIKKQRNQIKLTVDYKGMHLVAETDFTFTKQGQPGTNGTQYLVKLVPNTSMNNPPLWPMITKAGDSYFLNYQIHGTASEQNIGIYTSYQFLKAQLWRSGQLVWEGLSIDDLAKDNLTNPTAIRWEILANKYSFSSSDISAFSVTNANTGQIEYHGDDISETSIKNPYANIIKCSITWQNKTYYGTLPFITAWTLNNNYRINLKDYTGWRYAIYTSDGILPQYDNSHPFEFTMLENIYNAQEDSYFWEDVSLVKGEHAVNFSPPLSMGTPSPTQSKKLIEILGIKINKEKIPNIPSTFPSSWVTGSADFFLSNRVIPKGTFVKNIKIGTGISNNGTILFINDNNVIVHKYTVFCTANRWTNFKLNLMANENLRLVVSVRPLHITSGVTDEVAFHTDGLWASQQTNIEIGDVMTFTKTSPYKFEFAVQWETETDGDEDPDSVYRKDCEKNQWQARPISRYDGVCVNAAIAQICKNNDGNEIGRIRIPIHFLLNKYGLSHINEWDGNSIQIDQEGGFILSPQMGAGSKNSNNQFTGVLMGEVKDANKTNTDIGLLGYSNGDRTFFLNSQNGSALFGKSGGAQITIDPNASRAMIYSGNFWESYNESGLPSNYTYRDSNYKPSGNAKKDGSGSIVGGGMIIDLTTPEIYFGNGNFYVNNLGYLHATGGGDIAGWKIGTQEIYESGSLKETRSILYSNVSKSGGRITLDAGTINTSTGAVAGPGKIYSHNHDSLINSGNGFYLSYDGLSIGSKFKVDYTGKMYIGSNATQKGGISGQDDGKYYWTINADSSRAYISYGGTTAYSKASNANDSNPDSNYAKVYLGTDGITIGRRFSVDNAGELTAYKGTIGGWHLDTTSFYSGTKDGSTTSGHITLRSYGSFTRQINGISRSGLQFAIGSNFGVTNSGVLYCSNAIISGQVTATKGTIGGWIIGDTELYHTFNQGTFIASDIKVGMSTSITQYRDRIFYIDEVGTGTARFYVNSDGLIRCQAVVTTFESNFPSYVYIGGSNDHASGVWGAIEVVDQTNYNVRAYINHENISVMHGTNYYSMIQHNVISVCDDYVDQRTLIEPGKITVTFKSIATEITAYQVTPGSDRRLKTDIEEIDSSLAKSLHPVSFRFLNEDKKRYGFIAQEVQEIIPSIVRENSDGYLGLSYFDLIAPLYALVQQQQRTIENLELRLSKLQKRG